MSSFSRSHDDNEQTLADGYQMVLPSEDELRAELAREREEAEPALRLTGERDKGDV